MRLAVAVYLAGFGLMVLAVSDTVAYGREAAGVLLAGLLVYCLGIAAEERVFRR